MARKGTVAIIGRPNVGKSTLFNRIIKDRLAIVEDTPGVTRDRIYAYSEWLTREFLLIDTGGITLDHQALFAEEIKMQAEIAINEADVIVFVVSYKEGISPDDEMIAKMLYKAKKPVILAINKYDKQEKDNELYEYMALGFGEPIAISASHGIGIGDLLDQIISYLDELPVKIKNKGINFSIIGRPNVGKSSLTNAILGEERVIVSDIAGTTTDSIDTTFTRNKTEYTVIDTAGIRRKGKVYEKLEKYSVLRAVSAIERSDIVLLLIDGTQKVTDQDTNIGGLAFEQKKPVIIVVNKWDAISQKTERTMNEIEKQIRGYFKYLNYAKMVFVSALEKKRLNVLFSAIEEVYAGLKQRVKTSVLNEILVKAQLLNPPPDFNGGRVKIYYATQPESTIPTFIMFCNNPQYVHFSYKRFLENQIRDYFGFNGVPINILFRERK
ncbi:ribosome biogenesis GTPase Der [Spiroplasma eriocheiris]|uniref:GTPase Der n=1 Tax=Spiroplasma eriocheiris TaxID=315358 RepID=A0A0H3XKK3_9MOLU|nr:ribosome biogenesis GTPase Der [Spiroplasma eriocheiris]AHF57491.1 GTP-binding protein EngA [Spiroplasma eriocheiris CCTCC M 207170]AKM53949.1 GTP-binding protein EngA [Spiroplasma eriocheiris]